MKKILAFHNKELVKNKYVSRVEAHYKADEIIQGKYWENGKGCAVGCTMEVNENVHKKMEKTLNIPRVLCHLEDHIFEGLTNGEAKKFPLEFLKAIPVGADLSLVWPKFAVWLLVDKKYGVIQYVKGDGIKAIQDVADLYKRVIKGEKVNVNEWLNARRAANAAYTANAVANAAADAYAADAYAAYAAYAAADAAYAYAAADAAYAAADAAYAAADAYAAYVYARIKHYSRMAKKLINLLSKSK